MKLVTGWFIAIASFAFCVFGTKSFSNLSYDYEPIWEMIFAAFSRSAWSFGVCWIIYASVFNSSGMQSKHEKNGFETKSHTRFYR